MIKAIKRNIQYSSGNRTGKGRFWGRVFASRTQSRKQAQVYNDVNCLGCDAWVHVLRPG